MARAQNIHSLYYRQRHCKFNLPLFREPMESVQSWANMAAASQANKQSCCCVLYRLQTMEKHYLVSMLKRMENTSIGA